MAQHFGVTRVTLYKYLKIYESGKKVKEPYQSVFDAFFLNEKGIIMKETYKCLNGNIIVKIIDNTAINSNGTFVKNSETRGKRDIVAGEIIVNDNTHLRISDIVYFSYYAAQPLELEGQQVYVVHLQDIKFIKRKTLA